MLTLLPASVGLGLMVSLLFTELFGLAAGGMVVPGYIALYLTKPMAVGGTLLAGLLTFLGVHALKSVVILYGRRLTALTILLGYAMGLIIRQIPGVGVAGTFELEVIGYIIPGLIAIWIHRQGIVETMTSILTVSAVTRLLLVLIAGEELMQ
jgi:poly-gamma-glutamate biosynthesis protein PgsC/CapC